MKNTTKKSKFQTKVINNSFTGTNITKYAGLSPIMKFFGKLKIGQKLNKIFPTTMHNASKFTNVQILLTVILSSLAGIKRISRISNFSSDGLLKAMLGLKKQINENAISAFVKSLGQAGAYSLQDFCFVQIKSFIKKTAVTSLTLDCDSTVFTVYGNQQGAEKGYNPHKKGAKSYHPLLAFGSELKIVVNSWFRPGSAYTSNGVCEFIKQTVAALPEGIKLFFRADSGFFDGKLFDLLELLGISYLVKVKLKNLVCLLEQQAWNVTSENKDVAICEFDYKGLGWSKTRKLKAVRSVKQWRTVEYFGEIVKVAEYEYACFCSDLQLSGLELYKKYSERSTSETWIEQVKSQLMAGKTLTNDFWANDILWQLNVFAYNLSVIMRFKIKKLWRQEHTTFKEWFINVPAKLVSSGGQLFMKIYQEYYFKEQWLSLEKSLM
jgi:hypothetical protein